MRQYPIFMFSGLLESGKTSQMQELLRQDAFGDISKFLLISCERGVEAYDEKLFDEYHVKVEYLKKESDYTPEYFDEMFKKHRPYAVFVEYNGMWNMQRACEMEYPDGLVLAQVITSVDTSAFNVNINALRMIISEHFKYSDTVLFNRCDPEVNQVPLRAAVKALSINAEVVFLRRDGEMYDASLALPFDLNAPLIDVANIDYGLFYLDCVENVQKYVGKTVKIRGYAKLSPKYPAGTFLVGREAMTCCANDIRFFGMVVKSEATDVKDGQWTEVTAKIASYSPARSKEQLPVLNAEAVEHAEEEDKNYVSFN